MPVYSVNRRRAIILLILSSVLLLTLDLRGNPVFDRARNIFSHVLTPFVTAGDVIATPIKNIWHGATDYEDLREENEALRARIDQQLGAEYTNRAFVSEHKELLAADGLIANYNRVTARVIGDSTSNFRQTIEIDRGTTDGIREGMAVINSAGLVGKITAADDDRSIVLLATDPDYVIECKVSGVAPEVGVADLAEDDADVQDPTDSAQSGDDESAVSDPPFGASTSSTTTTTAVSGFGENPQTTASDDDVDGPTTSTTIANTTTTITATTTTTPQIVQRETGGCEGRGVGTLPVMKFVSEDPLVGTIGEGDIVSTAGGSGSLVPPDIIIGPVVNKIQRAGSAGPLLEIDLAADLDNLGLVQVVLYTASSEVPG